MSMSMEVSPLLRVQYGRRKQVQPLRGVVGYASEEEQKQRWIEANKRLNPKPPRPKPLLGPIPPAVIEPVKPPPEPITIHTEKNLVLPAEETRNTIRQMCEEDGVLYVDLMDRTRRTKKISHCRARICYHLRESTHLSLPQIGRLVGMLDHSSVHRAIQMHAYRMNLPMIQSDFYNQKWSDDALLSYACLHYAGLSYSQMARVKGVGRQTAVNAVALWRRRNPEYRAQREGDWE